MKYHFKIHREKGAFWAECLELSGCFAQGDSTEELQAGMSEALDLYLEEPHDSKLLHPLPDSSIKKSRNVVEVQVDPSIAFAMLLRRERISNGMTQKEMAKRLDMKGVYSYQRLEKKCNPSFALIVKLVHEFPNLSVDRVLH